ncbi:multiheme c-type cytochrome [Hufsiella ginkgonis]|uniref:Cytochrome c-552/4 domain-containing protein n=1 Tax=Hufsiella ginkgonis TaxID=2695274 RepID=A0A7K1Y326_9SPHI|nr:multiheme c-type cytochrome [Hufsiella ginkgonis]MXV17086.1 hypothetical protein [Hufsiella ginkgonis]
MKGATRLFLVLGPIMLLVVAFSQCMDGFAREDPRGAEYAGAQSCKKCHAGVAASYFHTAHNQTSMMIDSAKGLEHVMGADPLFAFNDLTKIRVEKRDSGIYQVGYYDGREVRKERFDLKIGSGAHAQTYAYWKGKRLFQLPLSYFKQVNGWANSPGYVPNLMYYDRVVQSKCLECHSSFIGQNFVQDGALKVAEEMEKGSFIAGIDCERCHGPAKTHVEFHLAHPEEKKAKFMVAYRSLSRQRRLETCGVCHSGNDLESQRSTFGFRPGDTLSQFYILQFGAATSREADVHGKQVQMLAASKCFREAKTMDCLSCHDAHDGANASLALYSQKCMSCHNAASHAAVGLTPAVMKANCIDCHMPQQPSKVITFKVAGKEGVTPYLLRTHRIAVYGKDGVNGRPPAASSGDVR